MELEGLHQHGHADAIQRADAQAKRGSSKAGSEKQGQKDRGERARHSVVFLTWTPDASVHLRHTSGVSALRTGDAQARLAAAGDAWHASASETAAGAWRLSPGAVGAREAGRVACSRPSAGRTSGSFQHQWRQWQRWMAMQPGFRPFRYRCSSRDGGHTHAAGRCQHGRADRLPAEGTRVSESATGHSCSAPVAQVCAAKESLHHYQGVAAARGWN
mmetsp:Transcript_40664/g.73137  ORF Transcript_40664/g.73137 Transcript_40664/m.73137 type:complete len:216 (-) Transcript_40664:2046-2693(-)